MKKIVARLLAVSMVLNTLIGGISLTPVFAATDNLNFQWNQSNIYDQTLNAAPRSPGDDTALLSWDFGTLNGVKFDQGTYDLTYHLDDNKEIRFNVARQGLGAIVTYNVYNYATGANVPIDFTAKNFSVYRTSLKGLVENPTATTYPAISTGYGIVYNAAGKPDQVQFNIAQNQGFNFTFDSHTVTFYWKGTPGGDTFMYCTNGVTPGDMHDFNLNLNVGGRPISPQKITVFTGINKTTFTSTPFADDNNGIVDQTADSTLSTAKNPGVKMTFDKPKYWDDTEHKFSYKPDAASSIVLKMQNQDSQQIKTITIGDIYAADLNAATQVEPTASTIDVKSSDDDASIVVTVSNLKASMMYSSVDLSFRKSGVTSDDVSIAKGVVYTYPEFKVRPVGAYEYYLDITPYQSYAGYYYIYSLDAPKTTPLTAGDRWAERYYDPKTPSTTLSTAVNLNAINPQTTAFKVEFRFDRFNDDPTLRPAQQHLDSQYLIYRPDANKIGLGTPKNLTVIKSVVTRTNDTYENGDPKEALYVTLKWDVALESVMKSLINNTPGGELFVDYNFKRAVSPNDTDKSQFATVRVYYKINADGHVVVDMDKMNAQLQTNPELDSYAADITSYEVLVNGVKQNYLQHQVTLKMEITSATDPLHKAPYFQYPNIYFLTVAGAYTMDGQLVETEYSTSASITVDPIAQVDVLPPQNLQIVNGSVGFMPDKKAATFKAQWDLLSMDSLSQYIDLYLTKRGLLFGDIKFEAYLSTSKKSLEKITRESLPATGLPSVKTYALNDFDANTNIGTIDLSDSSSGMSPTAWFNANTDTTDMNVIRIRDITQGVFQSNGKLVLQFNNASKNQDYYLKVFAYVVPKDADPTYKPAYSKASSVATVTTPDDTKIPNTDDRDPEAPKNFSPVASDVTFDHVTLQWNAINYNVNYDDPANYTITYEMLRLKDKKFEDLTYTGTKMAMDTKQSFANCYNLLKANTATDIGGYKGDATGVNKYVWSGSSFVAPPASVTYTLSNGVFNIKDTSVLSNALYFYYIRTVKTDGSGNQFYSVWVPTNATTTPIGQIKNLKYERSDEAIANYKTKTTNTLNTKTEALISFMAPQFDDTKTDLFQFKYSIKLDGGSWSADQVLAVNGYYDKSSPNADGYVTYYYKIAPLQTGTTYNLRVKFFDKIMNADSSYSNIIQIRTEADQTDIDSDNETNDWITYYKNELAKIGKDPYWFLDNSTKKVNVVYKASYFNGLLGPSDTSLIPLVSGNDANDIAERVYYIPASILQSAFDNNKGFIISYKNADMILSAGAIDPSQNAAIRKIKEEIKTKENIDYCIKITVSFNDYKSTIEDATAISPTATISIDVNGTTELLTKWEARMQTLLETRIADAKLLKNASDDIKSEMGDNVTNAEMVVYIKDLVDDFKSDFADDVSSEFDDILDTHKSMDVVDGTIYYAYPVDSTTVAAGYDKSTGYYVRKDVIDYNGKKAISGNALTTYVIAGRTLNLPGLTSIPNATVITALFAKYGLDAYFGSGFTFKLDAPVTKKMAAGVACKLMGATGNFDIGAFLAAKGITIGGRGLDEAMGGQEALYYTMLVYEARTNTKIETMTVRNFGLTANMKGLTPKYKKSVQIAMETGIYTNPIFDPTAPMALKDYLQVLVNLATKTNL